jgi:glucans biosynthesis protein
MSLRQRVMLSAMLAWLPMGEAVAQSAEERLTFERLVAQARELSQAPHRPPQRTSEPFLQLTYDTYRLIAPRHDTALWKDTNAPFWAEFFPAGFLFEYQVEINVVDRAGRVTPLAAGEKWFQFRGAALPLAREPNGGGFSGLRLLAKLPGDEHMSEFAVFQGASYYRLRGAGQWYGASARGLAVDVGLPSPEEFPRFTKFWLEEPAEGATSCRVWALMDSPATAGAYQFVVTPGRESTVDVEARVWFRHGVQKVGIAPLTSMWMWDEPRGARGDPRPEVHDSDGLLIEQGGDAWTWRPLARPAKPRVTTWAVEDLRGFGLLQRDRERSHYQDNEAQYDRRPSLWVTPRDGWGPGRVELLELPSETEGGDNIGAYWVGNDAVGAGAEINLRYRVTCGDGPKVPVAQVVGTQIAPGREGAYRLTVDFAGVAAVGGARLTPEVTADAGSVELAELTGRGDTRRLTFQFMPSASGDATLSAALKSGESVVSETWSYRWMP